MVHGSQEIRVQVKTVNTAEELGMICNEKCQLDLEAKRYLVTLVKL